MPGGVKNRKRLNKGGAFVSFVTSVHDRGSPTGLEHRGWIAGELDLAMLLLVFSDVFLESVREQLCMDRCHDDPGVDAGLGNTG